MRHIGYLTAFSVWNVMNDIDWVRVQTWYDVLRTFHAFLFNFLLFLSSISHYQDFTFL